MQAKKCNDCFTWTKRGKGKKRITMAINNDYSDRVLPTITWLRADVCAECGANQYEETELPEGIVDEQHAYKANDRLGA